MNEMQDLYQEIILDHNKRPRNFRVVSGSTHKADGHNPLCGDEISIMLRLENGVIEDIAFQGEGCAISRASASLLTTELAGKAIGDVEAIKSRVIDLLTNTQTPAADLMELGDLAALQGVRVFPARVKCATLAWHTLDAALSGKTETSTEETAK